MVMLLMMPMTLVNQAVVDVGVEGHADDELDRRQRRAFRAREKIADLGRDDLLRVAGADAGLHHRGRVDVDLDRRAGGRPSTSRSKCGGMSTTNM